MMPRFNNRQAAENFASFAAEVSGSPCSVHNVRNAWVVAPTHVQPEFWRIANAWGYCSALSQMKNRNKTLTVFVY